MAIFNNKIVLALMGVLLIGGIFGFVFYQESKKAPAAREASTPRFADKNNEEQSLVEFRDERDRRAAMPEEPEPPKPGRAELTVKEPAPLPRAPVRSYGSVNAVSTPPEVVEENKRRERTNWRNTAPFGRLLKCTLMNTLQSIDLTTPILGVVSEDLMWDGEVVIPAGTEVHGRAQNERSRDRLGAESRWILILKEDEYQTRRELVINGLVLDRSYDLETDSFGPLDGSSGFRGKVIEDVDDKLIKLFAATFISGLSGAFTETSTNDAGTIQVVPSVQNGLLGGTSNSLQEVAAQIRASIEREGFYTQVAGGTEFYIYVQQGIDRNSAVKGLTMSRSGSGLQNQEGNGQQSGLPNLPDLLNQTPQR